MRIAVLTSSRADYGIYRPLLQALEQDTYFDLSLLVFGTHLSRFHGYTIQQIEKDGFKIIEKIESLILGDSAAAVSNAMGNTLIQFSTVWNKRKNSIDLVIALGDRYEMFAAVAAAVPFNIPIAHIHGGETTLGAIDNQFRHSISLMSSLHFTATQNYAERVAALINTPKNIHYVGALSLDNINTLELLSLEAFQTQFNIDLSIPTVLCTFHPETVSVEKNIAYTSTLVDLFEQLSNKYQIVITMPNADTMGNLIRTQFLQLAQNNAKVITVESFGSLGYFSCMQHCSFLIGNTSSGIIEAASLGKFVINLGTRQQGRALSKNTFTLPVEQHKILQTIAKIEQAAYQYKGKNIYHKGNAAKQIVSILKSKYSMSK